MAEIVWKTRSTNESEYHWFWVCNCKVTVAEHDGDMIVWYVQDKANNMSVMADNNVIKTHSKSTYDEWLEKAKTEAVAGVRAYLDRKLRRLRGEKVPEITKTTATSHSDKISRLDYTDKNYFDVSGSKRQSFRPSA